MHPNSWLLFEAYALRQFRSGMRVLEIGSDSSPSQLEHLVRAAFADVTWDASDVGDHPIPLEDELYDAVVASDAIEHISRVWVWIKEVARMVRPGGVVVIIAPASRPYRDTPSDCWRIYPEAMGTLAAEAGLEVIECRVESLEPPATRRSYPGASRGNVRTDTSLRGRARRLLGWPQPVAYDTILIAQKPDAGTAPARPARQQTTPAWPPAGHYYSPIPDLAEVRRRHAELFETIPQSLPGIDLRAEGQLSLLPKFAELYRELPFRDKPTPTLRYGFENGVFEHGDGTILYSMLRFLAPRRYVEIGSGWSSALALDVRDRFLGGNLQCTFIEPNPDRLNVLLRPGDAESIRFVELPLQAALAELDGIEAGDFLFIDSTHVGKIGSDVLLLIHEVLPRLPPGVHVHVHDIFYPFQYPAAWLYEGRAWNEAYLLRAYLSFNSRVQINWFSSYLACFHKARVEGALPSWGRNTGGSLWLETC